MSDEALDQREDLWRLKKQVSSLPTTLTLHEKAEAIYNATWDTEPVQSYAIEIIAAALAAERDAERERCAQIAMGVAEGTGIASAIRRGAT
jgi:hypothetical protein